MAPVQRLQALKTDLIESAKELEVVVLGNEVNTSLGKFPRR
jgi:hypothetical protein